MKAIPVIHGSYRFSRSISSVPLRVGLSARHVAFITRNGSYDYANSSDTHSNGALTFSSHDR